MPADCSISHDRLYRVTNDGEGDETVRIKEIIVVEGKADTVAVNRAVVADTIETGGSAISEDVLKRIKLAQRRRGVIVFTDPDYAGERIRRIVRHAVTCCKHAFLPREAALNNGKVGVEYAAPVAIRHALAQARAEHLQEELACGVTWEEYVSSGLTAHPMARKRRERIGHALGIGYANARGLYNRLRALCISADEFRIAVQQLNEGEGR